MLVVSYESRELADRCTKLEVAQAWLGATEAQALIDLIADLEAFPNADEAMTYWGATADGQALIMLDFSRRHRAILRPLGDVPNDADGTPDWAQVRRLMLAAVVEL